METSLNMNKVVDFVTRCVTLQLAVTQNGNLTSIPWLSGPPGIGKSEVIRQICRDKGWGLRVVYMATIMLEQITGLPAVTKDRDKESEFIRWSRPEIFNLEKLQVAPKDRESPIIMLLDDAHLCNRQIQAYLFQLLTYRSIHDHKLPDNVALVLAGNRGKDKAGFQEILAPVANRIFFINLHADLDQWVEVFAIKNNIRSEIISFLQQYPEYLVGKPMESTAWASPRSWTYASINIDSFGESLADNTLFTILSGHVGTEATTKFIEYHELYAKWNAAAILNESEPVEIESLSKIESYALLSSCSAFLLKSFRENGFKLNGSMEHLLGNFESILSEMIHTNKEIVPLGLKQILLGERTETGRKTIIERLTADKEVVYELFDIV
jgi:hypothetical protein